MNILQAIDDPKVFGAFFRGPTWDVWRVFLAALFALPMTQRAARDLQKHTGRTHATDTAVARGMACVSGDAAARSFILAIIAVFLACFRRLAAVPWPG